MSRQAVMGYAVRYFIALHNAELEDTCKLQAEESGTNNEVSSFGCFCLNKEKSFSVSSCEQFFRSEERIHAEKQQEKLFTKLLNHLLVIG